MFRVPPEFARLALLAAAGAVFLAGITLDLCLAILLQRRTRPVAFFSAAELHKRPFALPHAALVVMVTLLFAATNLSLQPGAPPPAEGNLIAGPLFYAFAGLLTVALCLFTGRSTFRAAFLPHPHNAARTLRDGVVFGLAVIPPVTLLSLGVAAVTERLGFEPQLQEVFDWLNDGATSGATRAFMMAAAVFIAPVVEETLFRGILFPALLKGRSFASASLLSGLYFALVHFHAPSLLPLLALSVGFCAAYARTGSLLTPIIMHAVFNATSLLLNLAENG